ncbi:MAG: lactonase family protein, partial [Planctomycetota bacterium]
FGSSVTKRQKGPHAHSIHVAPSNRFAISADLGLDKVLIYGFDAKEGKLTVGKPAFAKLPAGSGPRHMMFHPSGDFVFVNGELDSTVHSFRYDKDTGALTPVNSLSTIPGKVPGNSTAETQVHPSGRFVYVSNRGHNSIAVYSVHPKTGALKHVENESSGGKVPRNFCVAPGGKFVVAANQQSSNVAVLKVDPKTGALSPTKAGIGVPTPVCVKFLRKGK